MGEEDSAQVTSWRQGEGNLCERLEGRHQGMHSILGRAGNLNMWGTLAPCFFVWLIKAEGNSNW